MDIPHPASWFGRHEFVIRRLHSLTGLIPIGGYLCFHLATNAAIIDGPEAYQHRADQIHQLGPTTILFLEWSLIFLPILFHGLIGAIIVLRGKRNVAAYPYRENWRYTLQRGTGVVALVFILWHVFHMHGWFRFEWWVSNVARPLGGAEFNPEDAAATATAAIQASWLVIAFYAIGVLSAVYHLANGLWTMGITWGVWTSPHAQRWANLPCAGLGVALAIVGLGALYAMATTEVPAHQSEPAGATAGLPSSAPDRFDRDLEVHRPQALSVHSHGTSGQASRGPQSAKFLATSATKDGVSPLVQRANQEPSTPSDFRCPNPES